MLHETQTTTHAAPTLIGSSDEIARVRQAIERAASTSAKVMITGETGAGKEVVAQMIHHCSARRSRRFVAVNCSGIPETLLESELFGHVKGSFTGAMRDKTGLVRVADGGTLFLDELGEMSLRMQASLLRFTETGEVHPVGADLPVGRTDVRIITATHRDLRARIDSGDFREDLYYRLNVILIRVPSLRERASDIPELLDHFLIQASRAHRCALPRLTPEVRQRLLHYAWPGNVRELKNVAERLVVCGHSNLTIDDLPGELGERPRTTVAAPAAPAAPVPAVAEAGTEIAVARPVSAPEEFTSYSVDALWARLEKGEDFWSVVHRPFREHNLTRQDVRALVFRGLKQTRGSYRQVVKTFQMPDSDYKRFMAFLSQYDCNLPYRPHRTGESDRPLDRMAS
jgi:transcriptional regulator with PAS, ATPase and Fis domain